jgi:plasmid stabilization system protein ParE
VSSYILSVDAEFDLDDIWEYIATGNIDAADRWIEKLFGGNTGFPRHPRVPEPPKFATEHRRHGVGHGQPGRSEVGASNPCV